MGFKPSFGRLSREGLTPAHSSLDCVGPLARDMETVVAAMAVLDPSFTPETMDHTPRIGIVRTEAVAEVSEATRVRLLRSECALVEADLPGLQAAFTAAMTIMNAEMHAAFGHLLEAGGLGPDVDARLRRAAAISAASMQQAERMRATFAAEVESVLAARELDALAMPTLPAFPVSLAQAGNAVAALEMSRLVRPFNLSGHPAITIPAGEGSFGPIGLQVVGRMRDDAGLCAVAAWLEQRIDSAASRDGGLV